MENNRSLDYNMTLFTIVCVFTASFLGGAAWTRDRIWLSWLGVITACVLMAYARYILDRRMKKDEDLIYGLRRDDDSDADSIEDLSARSDDNWKRMFDSATGLAHEYKNEIIGETRRLSMGTRDEIGQSLSSVRDDILKALHDRPVLPETPSVNVGTIPANPCPEEAPKTTAGMPVYPTETHCEQTNFLETLFDGVAEDKPADDKPSGKSLSIPCEGNLRGTKAGTPKHKPVILDNRTKRLSNIRTVHLPPFALLWKDSNISVAGISHRFGITESTAYRWATRLGLPRRPRNRRRLTDKLALIDLLREKKNHDPVLLGSLLDVSSTTILREVKKINANPSLLALVYEKENNDEK